MTEGEGGRKEVAVDAEQDGRGAVEKMEESEAGSGGSRRSKESLEDEEEEEEVVVGT